MELGNWTSKVKNGRLIGTEPAELFKDSFKKMIDKKGYKKVNVYNKDETGLYWKKMPTLVSNKASKSRITTLICAITQASFASHRKI